MRLRLSTAGLALSLVLSCDQAEPTSEVTLCGPFVSRWTPLRAEDSARELGLIWSARVKESYEHLEIVEAQVGGFEDLRSHGKLFLYFYNDELAKCEFYPVDFRDYVKRLSEGTGVENSLLPRGEDVGGAYVWVWDERQPGWREGEGRFVGWRDDEVLDPFKSN